MIWLNRLVVLIMLLSMLYYGWPYVQAWQQHPLQWQQHGHLERLESAQKSLSYLIRKDRWTEFPLNDVDHMIRVISHANLRQSQGRGETWHYAFEYQIIDKNDEVVVEHIYHHRARILDYEDADKNPQPNKYFYADPNLNPTSGQIMVINLEQQKSIRSLRLRLHEKDEGIVDVNARLYQPSPVAEHKFSFFWKRLHKKQKERLASGNLYPILLLKDAEIHHLLENYLSPLGPTGVEGEHYEVRPLYIDQYDEIETVGDDVMPKGLLVFDGFHGTIPIHQGGDIRLELIPLPMFDNTQNKKIQYRWYGKKREDKKSFSTIWYGKKSTKTFKLEAGLLEVISRQPMLIRVYQEGKEITPEAKYLRMYQVDVGKAIDFAIEHERSKPTPIRFMIRSMSQQSNQVLKWSILDDHGQTLERGEVPIHVGRSQYDRPLGAEVFSTLSEPVNRYLSIKNKGKRLHLESNSPLWVAMYSRPYSLIRHLRVPKDYEWFVAQEGEQRGWFLVRPLAYEHLLQQARTKMVRVQTRPPIENQDLMQGHYVWEEFHPKGLWKARYLLLKRDVDQQVRREAVGSVFRPIALNKNIQLQFNSQVGQKHVRASVVLLNPRKKEQQVAIYVDQRLVDQFSFKGHSIERQLPIVEKGRHQLLLQTRGDFQALVNYATPEKESYQKRLANRFDRRSIEFHYQKRSIEREVLTAVFYPPKYYRKNIRLKVEVQAERKRKKGANQGWTFLNRRFDLSPDHTESSIVLNSHAQKVSGGVASFVVLDKDLPKGDYVIRFIRESGPSDGYLTLFRVIAGKHEQKSLFHAQKLSE
ncbi:MAG: hypothetical protein Q9M28_09985 [Mariprofundaceae bacterium]|nr:hypothetical protein [Mariprofundaceae bacterium]